MVDKPDDEEPLGLALLDGTLSFSTALDRAREELGGAVREPSPQGEKGRWVLAVGVICVVAFGTVGATLLASNAWGGPTALTPAEGAIALMCSILPALLYLRFTQSSLQGMWQEYVLNLHRLGIDRPEYLPEPPKTSVFRSSWERAGGETFVGRPNIYCGKFESIFGAAPIRPGGRGVPGVSELIPVLLSVAVFALGWTMVLWDHSVRLSTEASLADGLRFAFVGAYVFGFQRVLRQFVAKDLRGGTYLSTAARTAVAVVLVVGLDLVLPLMRQGSVGLLVSYLIGVTPFVAVRAFLLAGGRRLVRLQRRNDDGRKRYALGRLEGVSAWDEARLMDEGIEDLQSLVTANVVDLVLRIRVPAPRLVDWIDQAILHLHVERSSSDKATPIADRLRALGIRTATDLEGAVVRMAGREADHEAERYARLAATIDLPADDLEIMLGAMVDEVQFAYVRSWKRNATTGLAVKPGV